MNIQHEKLPTNRSLTYSVFRLHSWYDNLVRTRPPHELQSWD